MASPAIVGTPVETAIATAATSHVVSLPNGAVGNQFVAVMSKGSAGTTPSVNALTGWTEQLDEAIVLGLFVATRVCDGSEGATTTFTLSSATRGAWIVYEISGAIDPATQAPQVGTTATGSSVSPNPPSVSVAGGAKDILTIAFFGRDGELADTDTLATAAPSGFTGLVQKTCGVAGTNLAGLIAAATLASNTATSDPAVFTAVTGAWRAQTIVIHPAPITIVPGAAAAQESALTPTLVETLEPAAGAAQGSAPTPTFATGPSVSTAGGIGDAPTPLLPIQLPLAVAAGATSALMPDVQETFGGEVGVALTSAPVPIIDSTEGLIAPYSTVQLVGTS